MKKFKCAVTRTDEYEIEIDDSVLDEEWMEEFRHVFYKFYDYEDHVEQLAQMRARFGDSFIEGYGAVLINGEEPYRYKGEYEPNRAVNINIISEDEDIDVDVEEI